MKASREQVDAEVMLSRREMEHGRSVTMRERASIIVALADERDALLTLVNDPEAGNACWASDDGFKKAETCDGQYNADGDLTAPVCWQHRAWELVAKIKGGG